jgi:sulfur carrier protein
MEIIVNGEPRQVVAPYTVADLLRALELTGRRLAVEVNLEIVPRSRHGEQQLQAGDRVEIVHAIGGG